MDREIMRNYCIQVAKAIIMDEGFQNISMRKVSIKSGFSNKNVSSIFLNIDNLRNDISKELLTELEVILNLEKDRVINEEELKIALQKYVIFYIDRPNLFKFFYQVDGNYKMKDSEVNKDVIREVLINRIEEVLCFASIEKDKLTILADILLNSLHGMILNYISENEEISKDKVASDISNIIAFIFN